MPIPNYVILRELRKLHLRSSQDLVDDSLRGWSWDRPPLRPRAYLGLSVSEVTSYCPTRRDTWLRRMMKIYPESNDTLKTGLLVHELIHKTIKHVRKYLAINDNPWDVYRDVVEEVVGSAEIPESIRSWAVQLVKYIAIQLVAEASWSSVGDGINPWLSWISEVRVDGSLLGLSKNLRVDALTGSNIVVDFKLSKPYENHKLMITAYAMVLEANLEVPVDYGLIIYINGVGSSLNIKVESLCISSYLRKDFIDARDEVIDMVLGEREPPKATSCNPACPFKNYCGVA